jgi:hypothetical protein
MHHSHTNHYELHLNLWAGDINNKEEKEKYIYEKIQQRIRRQHSANYQAGSVSYFHEITSVSTQVTV